MKNSVLKKKIIKSNTNILIALIPLYMLGWFYYGFSSIVLGFAATITAVILDSLNAKLAGAKKEVGDYSSITTALLITVMLPATTPIWIVVVGVSFALIVAKFAFGGTGSYMVNPAVVGYSFLLLGYSDVILKFPNPTGTAGILDGGAVTFAESPAAVVSLGGVPKNDIVNIILGNVPGGIGASCIIIIFACLIYLIATKAIDILIPVVFIVTVAAVVFCFPRLVATRAESVFYELFTGSMLFCAVFLSSDYTVNPKKFYAKIIYAVILGITTVIYQYFGAMEHGFCFAILICDAASPFIEKIAPASKHDKKWMEVDII